MTGIPIARAIVVWLVIIAVETVHGVLRGLLLVPVVGDFRARQIGVFIGSALILGVSWLMIRWMTHGRSPGRGALIRVGFLWTALTLAFEFSLGATLGRTWPDMLADYDLPHGGLMPFGLVILVLAPWIAAKSRHVTGAAEQAAWDEQSH